MGGRGPRKLNEFPDEPEAIVYPSLLEARIDNAAKTVHLGDGNLLSLQKASVLRDTLTVHSFEDNKRIIQTIKSEEIEGKLYENKHSLASLLLHETTHGILMEGLINHSYSIEPSFESERSQIGQVAHKIFKVRSETATFNDSVMDFDLSPDHLQIEARGELPEVFSPDVFVISDYEHNKDFQTTKRLIAYLVVFFNGVKLRYESVHYPRIVPRLVGVERAERGQEPYVVMHGSDMIAEYTLQNLQSYVEKRLTDFKGVDAVLLITGRTMVSVSTGRIRPGVAGLAMTGGLCSRRRVAESLDIGRGYSGIVHAAHELAHLMGSSHDQAGPVAGIPGNHGAYHCRWSDGYIMSYDYKDENQFRFSSCSQEQFQVFLRIVPATCIASTWARKPPKPSRRYPGDMLSRNKFCRRESGFPASKECTQRSGRDLCKITCCPGTDLYRRPTDRAEYWCLDGTNCGHKQECYSGECRAKRRK
ncbi:hypothetical protein V5799_015547 [Amblyomma americanum]|uniref:Peptidase M12B domain-containing protein n=1 Tax=Amblyomma americanum TaxID=6943 RepID=A0AAQ4F7Q1_AMBAM